MSVLIVPDDSKKILLSLAVIPAATGLPDKLKLFKNNYTPGHTTVSANLVEADFSGYVAGTLSGGAVSGTLDGSGRAFATWSPLTFTKAGATANTIYGYWVVDAGGVLLWVERFDSAIVLATDGSFIQVTPKFTGMSQYLNT